MQDLIADHAIGLVVAASLLYVVYGAIIIAIAV
jgi:hypothetical protein